MAVAVAPARAGELLVTRKPVAKLTARELDRCRELTLGDGGSMLGDLDWALEAAELAAAAGRDDTHARYTAVLVRRSPRGTVHGWALIEHRTDLVKFYVNPRQRRAGIGRKLLHEACQLLDRPRVCPWDATSREFFARFSGLVDFAPGYRL